MEQESLLKKLMKRIISPCYNRGCQVAKRITGLAIAAGMVLSLTACDLTNLPVGPAGSTTTQQQGGPSNPNQPGNNHSDVYNLILQDEYYKDLIAQGEKNKFFRDTAYFDPNPYGFLEDEGHDVDKIKNGALACGTLSFVLNNEPNSLYMTVAVENPGDYYTEYLLKYELTDHEMLEYNFLHGTGKSLGFYQQAAFINDAISRLKEVQIISECNVSTTARKNINKELNKVLNNVSPNFQSNITIILTNIDPLNNKFQAICVPVGNNHDHATYLDHIGLIQLKGSVKMQNNIFTGPSLIPSMDAEEAAKTQECRIYNSTMAYMEKDHVKNLYND